ncbi:MAG: protein-L-isoaspartate(D-aspartate) O-methyltransferase [Deltaproteobacteria bacterium]|nr:protein-L-isoaspartate(D-aspartate) O-methyltransferase [Deltaproteobacteria bacterium]
MKRTCFFLLLLLVPSLLSSQSAGENGEFRILRDRMLKEQIIARGIRDRRVIEAMEKVPRHLFVPGHYQGSAYSDGPLPIGEGQTISQPYIVAFMTEALDLKSEDRVLEIGTGSGYQAAVLAEIVKDVYSIEVIPTLARRARKMLARLGYENISIKIGDGYKGWPEAAPFDAVIVTCAPEDIPQPLVDQLKDGGRMVIPVGKAWAVQKLLRAVKSNGRLTTTEEMPVRFVPMIERTE